VVNIDQRTDFQGGKITPSVSGVRYLLGTRLKKRGPHMRDSRPLSTDPPLSAIEHPRCQYCQIRTYLAGIVAGSAGHELRIFTCPRCDRVHQILVVSDPMNGDARGWLEGELRSPN
jgi:hypothetical protein